jgi:transposase-like protein
MSNEEKSYNPEFKAKVVLETVSGEYINPHEVADKYNVSVDQILSWAQEMDISDVKLKKLSESAEGLTKEDTSNEVEIESSNETFVQEVSYGATFDILNMKRLVFWTLFGTGFVVMTILALMGLYHYSKSSTIQQVSEESEYYEIRDLKQRDQEHLSTFGVVDLENGVYRMPIDTVISRMADDEN